MKIGEEANSILELPSVFLQTYKSLSIQILKLSGTWNLPMTVWYTNKLTKLDVKMKLEILCTLILFKPSSNCGCRHPLCSTDEEV